MAGVNVQKAIEKIQEFGYGAGYLQTATFLITEPKPAPGRFNIRQTPVTVWELDELGNCASLADFEAKLAKLADIPLPEPPPRPARKTA